MFHNVWTSSSSTSSTSKTSVQNIIITSRASWNCPFRGHSITPSLGVHEIISISGNLVGRFGWAAVSDKIGRRATFNIFTMGAVPIFATLPYLINQVNFYWDPNAKSQDLDSTEYHQKMVVGYSNGLTFQNPNFVFFFRCYLNGQM